MKNVLSARSEVVREDKTSLSLFVKKKSPWFDPMTSMTGHLITSWKVITFCRLYISFLLFRATKFLSPIFFPFLFAPIFLLFLFHWNNHCNHCSWFGAGDKDVISCPQVTMLGKTVSNKSIRVRYKKLVATEKNMVQNKVHRRKESRKEMIRILGKNKVTSITM